MDRASTNHESTVSTERAATQWKQTTYGKMPTTPAFVVEEAGSRQGGFRAPDKVSSFRPELQHAGDHWLSASCICLAAY